MGLQYKSFESYWNFKSKFDSTVSKTLVVGRWRVYCLFRELERNAFLLNPETPRTYISLGKSAAICYPGKCSGVQPPCSPSVPLTTFVERSGGAGIRTGKTSQKLRADSTFFWGHPLKNAVEHLPIRLANSNRHITGLEQSCLCRGEQKLLPSITWTPFFFVLQMFFYCGKIYPTHNYHLSPFYL